MQNLKAVLSKKTSDEIKSSIKSPQLFQLVLDVYSTPEVFAQIVSEFNEEEFVISLKKTT